MEKRMNGLGMAVAAQGSGADKRRLLDAECKAFLADKQILAWILRDCTPEFRAYTIPEIMRCIEGEPEIGTVPVDKDLTGKYMIEKIIGMADEDTSVYEGTVRYDIRFKARARQADEATELIINVEVQNDYKPGYSLVTRGIYYCSWMIAAQMETEFSRSNYAGMKKAHSIWVCIRPNRQWRGSITIYAIGESQILGRAQSDRSDYDKMQVTLLCLGDKPAGKENVVGMLDVALANGMPAEEKIRQLETQYDIKVTDDLEGRLETMCNYSKGVYDDGMAKGLEQGMVKGLEKGMEQGLEKGMDTGIAGAVDILKRMGTEPAKIVEQLMLQYGLSQKEAARFVEQAKTR